MVAAMLRATMQSDNPEIPPQPIAIAIESLSKLAAKDSDRYRADYAAPGTHLHLIPRVNWYARDNQCHWRYRKIAPIAIATFPPKVTAPSELPGRTVKVGSAYNIVNRILQNPSSRSYRVIPIPPLSPKSRPFHPEPVEG